MIVTTAEKVKSAVRAAGAFLSARQEAALGQTVIFSELSPQTVPTSAFYSMIRVTMYLLRLPSIMNRALSLLLAAVLLLPAPAKVSNDPPDAKILAPYYIVVDAEDPSIVFYERDPDERCIPASTMKIMTCILTLEQVEDLDETVVITRQAASMKETNSLMHVLAGETLTIRQLLYGLMLHSGNDAAMTLANYVAGSVEAFAEMANAKAAELGMAGTHFLNASGAFRGGQYSTARDMAVLTVYALKNEMFRTLMSTARYTIEPNDVRKQPMEMVNSNRLISDDPDSDCFSALCVGGKTGSTARGGDCLVAVGELDGARVIVVLIGADDTNHRDANKRMPRVFKNGKFLIEYTLENDYAAVSPSALGYAYEDEVALAGLAAPLPVAAWFDESAFVRLPKTLGEQLAADPSKIEVETRLDSGLAAAKAGDIVGSISCSFAGRALFEGDLVAKADAAPTPAPTLALPESTPEPAPDSEIGGILSSADLGVYLFGGLSALLTVSLIVLIALNLRKRS